MSYNQNEIREKYAYFSSAIDIAAAASKPFSGVVERLAGVVYSIAGMGLLFMILTPIEWRLNGGSWEQARPETKKGSPSEPPLRC